MIQSNEPSSGLQVPFEIVREAWSEFELSDKTVIRIRPILLKAILPEGVASGSKGSAEELEMQTSQRVVMVILSPPGMRGARNPRPPGLEQAREMAQEERMIIRREEDWNYYKLKTPGSADPIRLKVRVSPSSAFRVTGVWNEEGDPYYVVNFTTLIGTYSPAELSQQLPKKRKPRVRKRGR